MSDPADKSDDLIAELAKLMAASPGGSQASVAPVAKPAPLDPLASSSSAPAASPTPVRIPGMDQSRPAVPPVSSAPTVSPSAANAQRAPVTGAIRIPGMDNPAPVSTSAPVSKFDFGSRPAAAAPIKQEPLSTLTERLAAQNPASRAEPAPAPQAPPAPIRIPSDLKPVSENRSFAQGPALSVTPAPAATPPASAPSSTPPSDVSFDFGFTRNPPSSAAAERPAEEAKDPIADLIAAEIGDDDVGDSVEAEAPAPKPAPVTPISRTPVSPQAAPQKPVITPVAAAPRPANAQPIPLKPVSVAPRAPETDRFAISPGVGLNIKPAASQPLAPPPSRASQPQSDSDFSDSDPMSEIESLIGEAVRVELAPPGPVKVQAVQPVTPRVAIAPVDDEDEDEEDEVEPQVPQGKSTAAPVVPPLSSQFAPRRSGLKEDSSSSAEDAILAAAAASGAQVDRIDPPSGDESPYRRLKVKPARSSWASGGVRQYVGMAVAGTLLLAAGLGLYWVLNMGRTNNTLATANEAPQLTADATPVKEVPVVQPSTEPEAARSPVLEQMAGTSTQPSAEQLVSTDETAGEAVPRDVTQVAAVEGDDTEGGLANRKVRTVTVRPDGTIVSGDDAVAGAEALPVERPNVPSVPTTSTETPNLLGDTTSVAMTDPVDSNTALGASPAPLALNPSTSAEAATAVASAAEAEIQPVFDPTIKAPTPMRIPVRSATPASTDTVASFDSQEPAAINLTGAQTPNGQIDLLGGAIEPPTEVAAAPPAAVDSSSAAAYVQLSSSPTQDAAEASRRSLNTRFGSLFGGNELVIQSADLGQKGTWYRVKLPAASLADAQSTCASIKANGGDCIVSGR